MLHRCSITTTRFPCYYFSKIQSIRDTSNWEKFGYDIVYPCVHWNNTSIASPMDRLKFYMLMWGSLDFVKLFSVAKKRNTIQTKELALKTEIFNGFSFAASKVLRSQVVSSSSPCLWAVCGVGDWTQAFLSLPLGHKLSPPPSSLNPAFIF